MDNDKVNIDYSAIVELVKNVELNKFIVGFIADEDSKEHMYRFLVSANRHGVSSETIMKIITDTLPKGDDGYVLPDEDDENVTPY